MPLISSSNPVEPLMCVDYTAMFLRYNPVNAMAMRP